MDFWSISEISFPGCIIYFLIFSTSQIVVLPVYFLSGILADHDYFTGDLFLFCAKESAVGSEE